MARGFPRARQQTHCRLMAIYHFSMKIIQRSQGRSATAAAAYRSGLCIEDARTGEVFDYTRRRGVDDHAILTPSRAPEWAKDSASLWNAVEERENRVNSQLARENVLALPHELNAAQRRDLLHGFVQDAYVKRGMAAQVDIHSANEKGDERNVHAHVLLTMRGMTRNGWQEKKARNWNEKETLREWRTLWADHMNRALERAGLSERVTEKSFEDLGLDKIPSRHLGAAGSEIERRGEKSRIAEENRAAEAQNRKIEVLKKQHDILVKAVHTEAQKLAQAKLKKIEAEFQRREEEKYKIKNRNRNLFTEVALADKENREAYARRELLARGPEFWAQVDKEYAQEEQDIRAYYNIAEQAAAYADARWRALELDTINGRFSGAYEKAEEVARALEANLKDAKWRQEEALGRLSAERDAIRQAREEREAFLMSAKFNAQIEAQRGGVEIETPDAAIEQDNAGGSVEEGYEQEQGIEMERSDDDSYGMEL